MVSPRSPVSEDEKARPVYWQRVLVTTACPVALVLVGARGSFKSAEPFLVLALVCGTIAAALARTWFASIVGSVLAAIALLVLVALLFEAACNGTCT
jgi:hypothetical protein